MKYFIALTFWLILTGICNAAEDKNPTAYLCIPTMATGFTLNSSDKWNVTQFNINGKKYLLKKKTGAWYWTEFGEDSTEQDNRCSTFNDKGFIKCGYSGNDVTFNKNTLRFQQIHPYGYVTSDTEVEKINPLTPYYEIGTCSPL